MLREHVDHRYGPAERKFLHRLGQAGNAHQPGRHPTGCKHAGTATRHCRAIARRLRFDRQRDAGNREQPRKREQESVNPGYGVQLSRIFERDIKCECRGRQK